ncbi:MAG TPA: hypothetical protein VIO94_13150 [Phenylobacterium sp.]
MTVQVTGDGRIALIGACTSEEAETLLQALIDSPAAIVDLRACEHIHTALVQVLLAADALVLGPASGKFLRDWVEPRLRSR